jgi:hypothetical protein
MLEGEGVEKSSEAESDPSGTSTPAAASRSVFLSYASHDAGTANSVCQFRPRPTASSPKHTVCLEADIRGRHGSTAV